MIDAHFLNLRRRDSISPEEEAAIRGALSEPRAIPADRTIIRAEEELSVSTLLVEGLMCRYKDLKDGQRQISALHIPGDFVDLHSFTLKRLDHNVMALTPCRIVTFPHARLNDITEKFPHLTRVYWFLTSLESSIQREWTLSLGRRTALQRLAALLCELFIRMEIVAMTDGNSFPLPLTQADLAECAGLTSVHVNRTLRELRERGLIDVSGRRATILDMAGLQDVGEFSPSYLYLESRDR
ncbi:MAG: Crp/Fnr family transcriptional regulator [Sphingomonas bacterium]|nr:Crp/Fnr family transcriptional regulator [Sphingomonas bacterium]MDB5690363.1 Crp/Fnr family transcriptional regulator [Sphingomonas bacterium]